MQFERAINLSILAMSVPGDCSRVESNEAAGSTTGGDGRVPRCTVTSKRSLAHASVSVIKEWSAQTSSKKNETTLTVVTIWSCDSTHGASDGTWDKEATTNDNSV